MARHVFKILKIFSFSKKAPFCFRFRLQDDGLKDSVERHGILMPLLVTGGNQPVVIAGYKRLCAARALNLRECPVLEIGKINSRDAFLLNLISNWRQGFSEMDRVKALSVAVRNLGMTVKDVQTQVMPLLGLPQDLGTLQVYLKADHFPVSLKNHFEEGLISFRCAASLLKFSRASQEFFAKKIIGKIKLTSSQSVQTVEWLADLMKRTGKGLESLLAKQRILKELNHTSMDPRTKADKFFEAVKRVRFPAYSAYRHEFQSRRIDIIQGTRNLRLEPIEGFEERGFELQTRIKSQEDLDAFLSQLSEKRPLLNSLFDVVL